MTRPLLRGAALIILSEALLAVMSAAIKALSTDLPNEMLVFFRNLFGLAVIFPIAARHGLSALRTAVWPLHALRVGFGVGAMYCFFYTLATLPLTEAILFKLTSPFFIPVIALLWLGERIPWPARLAILVGFIGVALVLQPGIDTLPPAALAGLAGACLAAAAKVTVRRLGRSEPPARIVFFFGVGATALTALPAALAWRTPSGEELAWLLGMGVCATGAQLSLTRAYALAPAGRIGPFTYVSVVFASLLGWFFWGEVPQLMTAAGSLFIIGAGILALQGGRAPHRGSDYNRRPRESTTADRQRP